MKPLSTQVSELIRETHTSATERPSWDFIRRTLFTMLLIAEQVEKTEAKQDHPSWFPSYSYKREGNE